MNTKLTLGSEEENKKVKTSQRIKALKGSFSVLDDFDYKKELSMGLAEKYLGK